MSTDRQVDGEGLGVQQDAMRAWCRQHGRRVTAVYVDEGVPGGEADLDQRVQLAAALDELRAGRADELLVYRLDRLAREMVLQEQLLAEIHRAGAQLHSTSAGEDANLVDDPNDPTRALIRQVLGAVAGYERSMIKLRMRAGRDRKRAAGGYAGGSPPYGHRAVGGELEQLPELAETVEIIRRLRRQGYSLREVAWELTDQRIPTARGRNVWHPQAVSRVLQKWADRN